MNLLEDALEARHKYLEEMEQENKEREAIKKKQMIQHLQSLCVKIFPNYQDEFEFFEKEPDFGKPYAQVADIRFMVSDTHGWLNVLLPCEICGEDHCVIMYYCYDMVSLGTLLEMPFKKCGFCRQKEEDAHPILKPEITETRKDRVFRKLAEILHDLQAEIE